MNIELVPISELEAVNVMLEHIGEQPINTIPVSGVSEATIAQQILHRTSRTVQNLGLHCNTEEEYPLATDTNGYIYLAKNVLYIDASDPAIDVIRRGDRLYNRTDRTYVFDKTLKCNITWFLPFEELPEHVRHYITVKAARRFQRNYLGSRNMEEITAFDEQEALLNFRRNEDRTDDRTLLQSRPVSSILRRVY